MGLFWIIFVPESESKPEFREKALKLRDAIANRAKKKREYPIEIDCASKIPIRQACIHLPGYSK